MRRAFAASVPLRRSSARGAAVEPLEGRILYASVVGRFVFYNHSAFDSGDPAATAADLSAIAPDKTALLPGQSATPDHYTTYSRGLNGLVIDLAGESAPASPNSFEFRAGTTDNPATWPTAPAPAQVLRLAPAGSGAPARYLFTWADGALTNQWLQVTVKADAATGLSSPDVFYFGNQVADAAPQPGAATVDAADLLAVRRRLAGPAAPITDPTDLNRDGRVDALDIAIVRSRIGKPPLLALTAPNVDSAAPTVQVTSPAPGSTVSGPVTLKADATDDVAVTGVQFLIDGTATGAEDTAAPYEITWNSLSVPDGVHVVTARARDAAGHVTTSAPRSLIVINSATGPVAVGQWSPVMDWPLVAINQVLLNDGRILMWDGDGSGECIGSSSARVYNPATAQFTPVPLPYFNEHEDDIFCSAQTLLADGRVLVVGGHDCDGPGTGIVMSNLFDPKTNTWTRGPDMHFARWYPTVTTLSDGRALVLGGSTMTTDDYVATPEIYDPVTNTFTSLTSAQLKIPSYAFVYQDPGGRVIVTGSDEAKMPTYALDVATQTWSVVDPTVLDAGSGVMYRPGQYLKAGSSYLSPPQDNGGDVPSKATAYTLDATAPTPAWQPTTSMAFARTHLNMTLLPDGNVLATGGSQNIGGLTSSKAVFPAEMWSPSTGTWSTLASMQTPRMYHSTAVLLPDGRVLVAGGGRLSVATDYLNAEYYSPPYLFRGARPTISSAPQSLKYGASFFVGTPDGADVASVALVRNSAVTHSDNMNQRYLPLSFVRTVGGLTVQAPPDAATAPPGDYMLFIVNTNGVPSVAPFLRFAAPYEDAQPPTAPTGLTAAGAPASATLTWTAATDDVGVAGYAVYRSTVPGFTPTAANQVGTSATTSFHDTGLSAGTYYYLVRAADIAGNLGPASNEASAVATADTVRPVVTLTGPSAGATVGRLVELKANASDDVAVVAVYFLVDGAQVGPEDTTAPYSFTWDSRSVANGDHSVTAVARDAGGNEATAHPITVTVENAGPPGLVAAYSFDEGSGAVAADASGHALNGTIDGATWSAAGKFGGALSFDGDHDLVTVPDADQLDLTTGMTLEAWVRPAALSGYRTIILKEVPGELSYSLYASGDTNSPNAWARIAGHSYGQYGSAPLPLNEWTHVAATYDGAGLVVYVNGTAVASRAITGPLDTSANPLRIGGNAIWGEYFSGLIDEVRIYNTALTEADIRGDMNRRIGITPAGETPPPSVAAVESTSAVSVPTPSTSPLRRRPRPRDLLE